MPRPKSKRTSNARITSAIRQLWLRSPERSEALKRDGYSCVECGVKQSKAKGKEQKVEVHHINGITWGRVHRVVRQDVLCPPDELETLCPECHKNREGAE